MANFFSLPKNRQQIRSLSCLTINSLYALHTPGGYFVRVRVCSFHPRKKLTDPDLVTCFFVDSGKREKVQVGDLFQIPANLASKQHLAMEVVLCNILPVDGSLEWSPVTIDKASSILNYRSATLKPLFITSTTIFCTLVENRIFMEEFNEYACEYSLPDSYVKSKIAVTNVVHSKKLVELKDQLELAVGLPKQLQNKAVPHQYYRDKELSLENIKESTTVDDSSQIAVNCEPVIEQEQMPVKSSDEKIATPFEDRESSLEQFQNFASKTVEQLIETVSGNITSLNLQEDTKLLPALEKSTSTLTLSQEDSEKPFCPISIKSPTNKTQVSLSLAGRVFQRFYSLVDIKVLWGQTDDFIRIGFNIKGIQSFSVEFESNNLITNFKFFNKNKMQVLDFQIGLYDRVESESEQDTCKSTLYLYLMKSEPQQWPYLACENFQLNPKVKICEDADFYNVEDSNTQSSYSWPDVEERGEKSHSLNISNLPPDFDSSDGNSCLDGRSSSDFVADLH